MKRTNDLSKAPDAEVWVRGGAWGRWSTFGRKGGGGAPLYRELGGKLGLAVKANVFNFF